MSNQSPPKDPYTKRVAHELVSTHEHRDRVRFFMMQFIQELQRRMLVHDDSKLGEAQIVGFAEHGLKLKKLKFVEGGEQTDEYRENKEALDATLQLHYAKEDHHPQHYKNGVDDMNLAAFVEMLCDWRASTERQETGNIKQSLDFQVKEFGINEQLASMMARTFDQVLT